MTGDAGHWLRVTGVNGLVAYRVSELNVPFVTLYAHLVRLVLQHCDLIRPVDCVAVSAGVPPGMFVEHLIAPFERIVMARSAHFPPGSLKQPLAVGSVRRMTIPARVNPTISLDMGVVFVKRGHRCLMTTDTTYKQLWLLMADPAISFGKGGVADRANQ